MPLKLKPESNPSMGTIDGKGAMVYSPEYGTTVVYTAAKLQAALGDYDYSGDSETEDSSFFYKIRRPMSTYSIQGLVEYAEKKANPHNLVEVGRTLDILGAMNEDFLLAALYLVEEGYCDIEDILTLSDGRYGSVRQWLIEKLDRESAGCNGMFVLGYLYTTHRNKVLGYLQDLSSVKIKQHSKGFTEISQYDWKKFSDQAKKCRYIEIPSTQFYGEGSTAVRYCAMKTRNALIKYLDVYVFSNIQPKSGGYYRSSVDSNMAEHLFADNFVATITGGYTANGTTKSDLVTAHRKYDDIFFSDIVYDLIISNGDNFSIKTSAVKDSITKIRLVNCLGESFSIMGLDSTGWEFSSELTKYQPYTITPSYMSSVVLGSGYSTVSDAKTKEKDILKRISDRLTAAITGKRGYSIFVDGYKSEFMRFISSHCDIIKPTLEDTTTADTENATETTRRTIASFTLNALPKSGEDRYRNRLKEALVSNGLSDVLISAIDSNSEQTFYRSKLKAAMNSFMDSSDKSLDDDICILLYAITYMKYYDWLFDTTGFGSLTDYAKSVLWNTFVPILTTDDDAFNVCFNRVMTIVYMYGKEYAKAITTIPTIFGSDSIIAASAKDDTSNQTHHIAVIQHITPPHISTITKTPISPYKTTDIGITSPITITLNKTATLGTSLATVSSSSSKSVIAAEKTITKINSPAAKTLTKLKGRTLK